jgi:hypothetical protein
MKLTKNELKLYNLFLEHKKLEQAKIMAMFEGEYENNDSKRVCISIALKGLNKKQMIKISGKTKNKAGIAGNIWEVKEELLIA